MRSKERFYIAKLIAVQVEKEKKRKEARTEGLTEKQKQGKKGKVGTYLKKKRKKVRNTQRRNRS